MKTNLVSRTVLAALLGAATLLPRAAKAHCDTMDGPVVLAAKTALEKKDVTPVLKWVKADAEAEIKVAFDRTLAVRSKGPEARELADLYFFETLVRIHRAGEGAPYTGLKPAGRDLGLAIPAGDQALEAGDIEPVVKLLSEAVAHGVREHFQEALSRKKFAPNNVPAGREFVRAYVEYIHYVEGIHQAASSAAHGHFPEAGEAVAPSSQHKD